MPYKDPEKQKKSLRAYYLANKEKALESTRFLRRRNTQIVKEIKESTPCAEGSFIPTM